MKDTEFDNECDFYHEKMIIEADMINLHYLVNNMEEEKNQNQKYIKINILSSKKIDKIESINSAIKSLVELYKNMEKVENNKDLNKRYLENIERLKTVYSANTINMLINVCLFEQYLIDEIHRYNKYKDEISYNNIKMYRNKLKKIVGIFYIRDLDGYQLLNLIFSLLKLSSFEKDEKITDIENEDFIKYIKDIHNEFLKEVGFLKDEVKNRILDIYSNLENLNNDIIKCLKEVKNDEDCKDEINSVETNINDIGKTYAQSNERLKNTANGIMYMCTVANNNFDKVKPILRAIDRLMKKVKGWKKYEIARNRITGKGCYALIEVETGQSNKELYFVVSGLYDNDVICQKLGTIRYDFITEIEKLKTYEKIKQNRSKAKLIIANEMINSHFYDKSGRKNVNDALNDYSIAREYEKKIIKKAIDKNFSCCERKFLADLNNIKNIKKIKMYIKYSPCSDCEKEIEDIRVKSNVLIGTKYLIKDKLKGSLKV